MRHIVFVPHLPCLALMLQHNSQVLPWHLCCNNAIAFIMAPCTCVITMLWHLPCHLCCNNSMAFAMAPWRMPWHCYNTSDMAKMRLCCSMRAMAPWQIGHKNYVPHVPQMGHKIGHKFGAQILGTELILKSIKIIYSTSFLVYVPKMVYKNYVLTVSLFSYGWK